MDSTINVLVTGFSGLPLPPTMCLPLPSRFSCREFLRLFDELLPPSVIPRTTITTLDNRSLIDFKNVTLADLAILPSTEHVPGPRILNLRLNASLIGGKGGFGSQLRAAGGRMSSRKRRQNAELATGSARNLDGRRLRTVTEAKNLAAYLATKPEMDRKEKEERRKRWEQVIELAEQREADMRAGKTADGRRKGLSEEWIQEKEDIGDSVKNAVKLAMAGEGEKPTNDSDHTPSDSEDEETDGEDPMELDPEDMLRLRKEAEAGDTDAIWVLQNRLKIPASLLPKAKSQPQPPRFAGFDDDDSSDDDSGESSNEPDQLDSAAKMKAIVRD